MKKIFTLVSAAMLLAAGSAYAQDVTFGNPKDGDGKYIVKYDLENGKWAEANDWTVGETFVFAVDITGTDLQTALAAAQASPADGILGYGVAFDIYPTNMEAEDVESMGNLNLDGRAFHIKDNIYGMVFNMKQFAASRFKNTFKGGDTKLSGLDADFVTEFNASIFGFGWTDKSAGAIWWNGVSEPIQGQFAFASAPYAAEKDSPEFWWDEIVPDDYQALAGMDNANFGEANQTAGYLPATVDFLKAALGENAIETVASVSADVVAVNYFDLQGRKLTVEPVNGMFIRQEVMSDGAAKAFKVVK